MYCDYTDYYSVVAFQSLGIAYVAQSPYHCSVSLTLPVVNVVHDENEQSSSLVSSTTSCVSTRDDHHVHVMSLSIKEPYYSTDVNSSVNSTYSTGSQPPIHSCTTLITIFMVYMKIYGAKFCFVNISIKVYNFMRVHNVI